MATSAEQRNPYDGDPARSWILVRLADRNGSESVFKLIADTGNPFALVIDPQSTASLNHGEGPSVDTNFGQLQGAWFQLAMPELGLGQKVLGYASAEVVASVKQGHADFAGLAGLPLLRLLEYGGNATEFWIRPPS